MRRLIVTGLVVAAAVVVGVVGLGASQSQSQSSQTGTYKVALDNAFGLIKGVDVKVAGVRAGKVSDLTVRPSDDRALVTIQLNQPGFTSFRSDVFCEVRPQSLIGEYFLDCQPGHRGRVLPPGSTVPVTHTATTIPADLVGNILRRPYRERLRLIFSELGVGLASRGPDLNETIRRAVPALRETNRVLDILDHNRFVIQQLTRNADTVLFRLSGNRRNLARFVSEARDTAAVSATHRVALKSTFRKLPGFLRQLRPTLRDLGTAATRQTPALRDLRASAPQLTTFLQRLGPFAEVSRPAIRTLGSASVVGSKVAVDARPTVAQLRQFTGPAPELAQNLAIVLRHLDDRDNAVERDPRSPGGQGYTGLEALLQYPFDQALAINSFTKFSHQLTINLILSECGKYTNAKTARDDPARTKRCDQSLGPNQPGVNQNTLQSANEQDGGSLGPRDSSGSSTQSASSSSSGGQAPSASSASSGSQSADQALATLLNANPSSVSQAIGPSPVGSSGTTADLLDFLMAP